MHDLDRTLETEDAFEAGELDPEIFEAGGGDQQEVPLSEEDEIALADELLGLSGEEELEQFLGKLFRGIGRGFKKVFKPLGAILKPIAKKLLPIAGGAVGTFFGGPLGGAVGGKLGSFASRLFEVDFESMDSEVQDFEVARRFVRLASTAARHAAAAPPMANPAAAARSAVAAAARLHAPGLLRGHPRSAGPAPSGPGWHTPYAGPRPQAGRWIRRGRKIVVLGV